jgi:hypothetical protein
MGNAVGWNRRTLVDTDMINAPGFNNNPAGLLGRLQIP